MRCFDTLRATNTINQICANSVFEPLTHPKVDKKYVQRGRKRLDVILPEFEKLGYQVNLQHFPYKGLVATNALITTNSNNPNTLLLTGHHDYCAALGAEDNATALAIMLELARCLAGEEMNVAFASFDLEEVGAKGSNHFVSNQSKNTLKESFAAVVALECLGSGKELVVCEAVYGAKSDPDIVVDLSTAIETVNHEYIRESFDWFYSDHVPFARQGIKTAELCSVNASEYYRVLAQKAIFDSGKTYNVAHTKRDVPKSIHPETINAAGKALLQFIRNRQ